MVWPFVVCGCLERLLPHRLASLFSLGPKREEDPNELKYVPPKQPKKMGMMGMHLFY